MYCSKCGKEIDYEATVCRECEQAEAQQALVGAPAMEQGTVPASKGNPRMRGFGKALAGGIMGFVALWMALITYIIGLVFMIESTKVPGLFSLFVLNGVPCALSLIFGIQSIKVFKATPADTPKPIVTLVLAILAIAFFGMALLFAATGLLLGVSSAL